MLWHVLATGFGKVTFMNIPMASSCSTWVVCAGRHTRWTLLAWTNSITSINVWEACQSFNSSTGQAGGICSRNYCKNNWSSHSHWWQKVHLEVLELSPSGSQKLFMARVNFNWWENTPRSWNTSKHNVSLPPFSRCHSIYHLPSSGATFPG